MCVVNPAELRLRQSVFESKDEEGQSSDICR